jgi:RHS repeat-associated protein
MTEDGERPVGQDRVVVLQGRPRVSRKPPEAPGTVRYVSPAYERNVGYGTGAPDVVTKHYAALGRLLATRRGGVLRWVGTDHLGSTIRVADHAFVPVDQLRYAPYGAARDAATNVSTDRRFTSQVEDAASGLYWYASRAYDPALGRFVCPDTIVPNPANPQSWNRFTYVLNNPLRYTDPSGHEEQASSEWEGEKTEASGSKWRGRYQQYSWGTKFVGYEVIELATALTATIEEFQRATWEARYRWLGDINSMHGLDGWFNNILGIIEYFAASPIFHNSEWAKHTDGTVLWVIQEGLAITFGLRPGNDENSGGYAASWAAVRWGAFFMTYFDAVRSGTYGSTGTETRLKNLWGIAEQTGVNYALALADHLGPASAAESNLRQNFVRAGNDYRTAVTNGRSATIVGAASDPRRDREFVRKAAQAVEYSETLRVPLA